MDGIFQDQSAQHTLYFLIGSLLTFKVDGLFVGSSTTAYGFTLSGTDIIPGNQQSFGSSITGPFTFAVLLTGELQIFYSVTFIVLRSGSFTDSLTWLGGIVPTADFCSLIGGCGLYISSQCVLSTESLNGELNINFFQITVASGATFQLGSSSLAINFRFFYVFEFNINGILQFLPSSGGNIFLPYGCIFNFFATAQFMSSVSINIQTYTGTIDSASLMTAISTAFQGPYFIIISISGEITQTDTGK